MRVAGVMASLAGGPVLLSGVAFGASPATQPVPQGLTVGQSVGEAVLGAPVTVTLTATAPTGQGAYGLVLTDTLPAGASYVGGSAVLTIGGVTIPLPLDVRAVASPAQDGTQVLVIRGIPDLPAGTTAAVSFQLNTDATLNAVVGLRGQAVASAVRGTGVPLYAQGLPLLASPAAAEQAGPAPASATVSAFGLKVTDSGAPHLATPSAPSGTTTETITLSEAPGLSPTSAGVDVYLPAGVTLAPGAGRGSAASAGATPPPASATSVSLLSDPSRPSLPAVPVSAPAPPTPPTPGSAPVPPPPSASFTDVHWDVASVGPDAPATLSVTLDVPAGGAAVLVTASGSTTVAPAPVAAGSVSSGSVSAAAVSPSAAGGSAAGAGTPAGTGTGAGVQAAPVVSSQATVDSIAAVPPPPPPPPPAAPAPVAAPAPAPTPAPAPAPASAPAPAPASAPAAAASPAGSSTGGLTDSVTLHKSVSAPSLSIGGATSPQGGASTQASSRTLRAAIITTSSTTTPTTDAPTTPTTAAGSAAVTTSRDPFVAPGTQTATPPASTTPTTTQPNLVTSVTGTATPSAPLAYTGSQVQDEFLVAMLAILAGAALAAGAVSRHRSPLLPGETAAAAGR